MLILSCFILTITKIDYTCINAIFIIKIIFLFYNAYILRNNIQMFKCINV